MSVDHENFTSVLEIAAIAASSAWTRASNFSSSERAVADEVTGECLERGDLAAHRGPRYLRVPTGL
jgi:hypothetical protein